MFGRRELEDQQSHPEKKLVGRVRRPGGGRKPLTALDEELLRALDALVNPATRGDPESPLRWTSKGTEKLAAQLQAQNHPVSPTTVACLLKAAGYSLQANARTKEGSSHPDRDAQFHFINEKVKEFQKEAQPVISVDAKKKELVGEFKNPGREWQPKGKP